MIHSITLSPEFRAVPYLANTALWMGLGANGLTLSTEKPNVVVGPNGAGKSALLTLLALQTLTYFTGATALDEGYTRGSEADDWWSSQTWRNESLEFLPGANFDTDNAPAVYYRPMHIAGNDHSIAAAMMSGYSTEARAYAAAVTNRSSGQGCTALLAKIHDALTRPPEDFRYEQANWRGGLEPKDLAARSGTSPWDRRAEVLKARRIAAAGGRPLILMDEPEQSLDTRAELALWQAIANADCATRQLVVATHSLYPALHPERFNIIEAEPGYLEEVQALVCGTALYSDRIAEQKRDRYER